MAKNWQKVQNQLAAKSLKKSYTLANKSFGIQNSPQTAKQKKYVRLSWANFVCANSASHRIFYPSKIICCYFLKSYRKSIFSTVNFNPLFCIKKFRNCRYDNDNYGSPKTLHPSYSPHKQHTYPSEISDRIFITKHDCHA